MQKILFLEPVFQEKIWGGKRLEETFHYDIPNEKTGECWAISAHKNGDCIIKNGPLKGETLSNVYQNYRDLFDNCESPVFPLLTKIIDANNDLSVQVHPDDTYAQEHENELGKTECWYIIDCDKDAEMVFGHHAQTTEAFREMIEKNRWNELLKRIKIKPGDFFYVPSGTIHALCKGTLVLETQQSSDTTYRVYDYERKDAKGQTRPLHLKQAIDVSTVPHKDPIINSKIIKYPKATIIQYIKSQFFTVEKWDVLESMELPINRFLLISVLNGQGTFNEEPIKKGDHFIVTSLNQSIHCIGNVELLVSYL